MALMSHARPIGVVIRDEKTPPRVRDLLSQITPIKKFGENQGLKPTSNYQDYVKLDRPAAVWVVSACKPLEFHSKEWKFPIVGSFPYLGWFDLKNAREFADSLKDEGWDVDLRGAGAYSTLGWFRDSILSSMISDGKEALGQLVNVVLHESVHSTVYIPGQSYFNESIASFVADRLTLEYFAQLGDPKAEEKKAYMDLENHSTEIQKKLHQGYETLSQIYRSSDSDVEKLRKKVEVLEKLQIELKLKRKINNATLVQYKTYHTGSEEFEALFQACGQEWVRMLSAVRSLGSEAFSKPQQDLLAEPIRKAISSCYPYER